MLLKGSNSSGKLLSINNCKEALPQIPKLPKQRTGDGNGRPPKTSKINTIPMPSRFALNYGGIRQSDSGLLLLNDKKAMINKCDTENHSNSKKANSTEANFEPRTKKSMTRTIEDDVFIPSNQENANDVYYHNMYNKYQTLNRVNEKKYIKQQPSFQINDLANKRDFTKDVVDLGNIGKGHFTLKPINNLSLELENQNDPKPRNLKSINNLKVQIQPHKQEQKSIKAAEILTNPFKKLLQDEIKKGVTKSKEKVIDNSNLPLVQAFEPSITIAKQRRRGVFSKKKDKSIDDNQVETAQNNEGCDQHMIKAKRKGLFFCCF